ncbi:MAG TPA: carbon storage regulator [Firmicutes bacterium]|jgi:carbon storage regulator|nr:carbon storage regulator [Bacillota bacterium]
MLVLRRKIEEGILIDGRITVRILGIDGDSIKIGVDAPRDISIFRSEMGALLEQNKATEAKSGQGA